MFARRHTQIARSDFRRTVLDVVYLGEMNVVFEFCFK